VSLVADPSSRRRADRRGWRVVVATIVQLGLVALGGAAGWWRPWHLTYLDLAFTWPLLGVVFLSGVGGLWHVLVPRGRAKVAGFVAVVLGGVAVSGLAIVESRLDDPLFRQRAVNTQNDVEVSLTSHQNVWDVWLRADRGLLSREHLVARIGRGDSAPPAVETRFTAPDELVVTSAGQDVYQLHYDPGSLDIEDATCRPFQGLLDTPGCMT
jgi:hypothetical protein